MPFNLSKMLTCYLIEFIYQKDEFVTDVLKEAIPKTYKRPPAVFLVKSVDFSEWLS